MLKDRQKLVGIGIVCLVIMAAGVWAWARGYVGVPGANNLGLYAPWGLYISLFVFFEAIAVGALLMAVFYKESKYRFQMAVAGCIAVVAAGAAIFADLGGLTKLWNILAPPNFSSPLFLDVLFMTLILIFGILLTVNLYKEKESNFITIGTGVLAAILPIATALLFTSLAGSPGWSSSLVLAVFLAQALLAGFAVMLILAKTESEVIRRTFIGVLIANILLVIGEIAYALYSMQANALPALEMMTGRYALLFWAGLVLLLLIPIVLIKSRPQWAGVSVLAGLLLTKYTFVLQGKLIPYIFPGENLLVDGLQMGSSGYLIAPAYIPTWEEFMVSIALFAFFVLAYTIVMEISKTKKEEVAKSGNISA
ncbi:MAG TPA: NrfD/PsrC family molybdoenzyme membrane anchor subunit [Syntrophomonadaceae bacterium]|nr:NrfD/PsrC family molybdoenzyme membrane anchor subunit [Syntrophomonadaceae bacterium]